MLRKFQCVKHLLVEHSRVTLRWLCSKSSQYVYVVVGRISAIQEEEPMVVFRPQLPCIWPSLQTELYGNKEHIAIVLREDKQVVTGVAVEKEINDAATRISTVVGC